MQFKARDIVGSWEPIMWSAMGSVVTLPLSPKSYTHTPKHTPSYTFSVSHPWGRVITA